MDEQQGPELDDHQYTVTGLAAYEAIYGNDFVSPGGRATSKEILDGLALASGLSILDIGSGLGGAAFMMAREYEAEVVGIDLSANMATEAAIRCDGYGLAGKVEMVHGDIMTYEFGRLFDLVHSREVFLHIADKPGLFAGIRSLMHPSGRLFFSDYCRGPDDLSEPFMAYMSEFGYDLRTVTEIGDLLTEAGFSNVSAIDKTAEFIAIHERELAGLAQTDLSLDEQETLRTGWLAKIARANEGEQRWGWFSADY